MFQVMASYIRSKDNLHPHRMHRCSVQIYARSLFKSMAVSHLAACWGLLMEKAVHPAQVETALCTGVGINMPQ